MNIENLMRQAVEIRSRAYVPYSNFQVGAALLTKTGKVYLGCNIENAAYPDTCCAERVAIFKAVSDGETEFSHLAVAADTERPVPPCGSCRQVMSEFFDKNTQIYATNLKMDVKMMTMEEILPFSFEPDDMKNARASQ